MPSDKHNIFKDFVIMDADKSATVETFNDTFYQDLDEKYSGFAGCELVSAHTFSGNWPTWEMHPKGDEVVVLLDGAASLILKLASKEKLIELTAPGEYVVVPKGVWHTAHITEHARMLFITPGQGTENKVL